MKEERILGMGFTRRTGLGYVMAVEYTKLGAPVTVGGSSEGSVQTALRNLQRRDGVDPNLLSGFAAELRDSAQIDRSIDSLQKPPEIVIYASARGMESFFLEMYGYLQEMNAIKEANESDATEKIVFQKAELRGKLALWLPESYADALAVNRTAPEYLVRRLVDKFGNPFKFVYINSTFGYEGRGPLHYANVYHTKHEMSEWISENAKEFARLGVDMHEEVDPVIYDTDTGETIISDIAPFWPEPVQRIINQTKVSRLQVFGSVKLFTDMKAVQRFSRPQPNRHFLVTRKGIPIVLDHFPEELIIEGKEFDF